MSVYVGFKVGKAKERKAYTSEYYCGKCGYPVSDHDSYCPECGGAFRKEDATERTCKPNEQGRCECGALIRWEENCEPYKTCDGLTAFRSIHPPVTRYHNYCPNCGAKVVDK